MAAQMDAQNLKGFANWLRIQWEEETTHAMKFYDHLLRRGGDVRLQAISQPKADYTNPIELFEDVLAHEKYITGRIHDLYDLAVSERDYPLQTLLHWFIDEQVEEEENATEVIEKLRLIGDSGPNLFLLDQELGQRQLVEEDV